MMEPKEAAKNLLAGKTCGTCSQRSTEFSGKCKLPRGDLSQGSIYYRELAKENTCRGWIEQLHIKYTSTPVNAKIKKLNVKWSMESQLEDGEIIKRPEEELGGDKK